MSTFPVPHSGHALKSQNADLTLVAPGLEWAYGCLAANLPSFEARAEQQQLTAKVAQALREGVHLVAEAPTGTGKSFAIALAIIAEYWGDKKRAVIATANNSLLEQYAAKDFPFLESIFPGLRWARAKGKGNYLCVDKVERRYGQTLVLNAEKALLQLREWAFSTKTGDREEIRFDLPKGAWEEINADETCTGRKCPAFEQCHYYAAREALNEAQIIITNFDLTLLDAFNPMATILPRYDALILDEAHQLEDKAISKLELSLSEGQVSRFAQQALKYGVEDTQNIQLAAAALFNEYRKIQQNAGETRQIVVPSDTLNELTHRFDFAMGSLKQKVSQFPTEPGTRARKAQDNLISAIEKASTTAKSIMLEDGRKVAWVEPVGKDVRIVKAPFRVGNDLNFYLFGREDLTVVALSATLAAGKPKGAVLSAEGRLVQPLLFEQFRKKVGLVNAAEFICPSPFNYAKNCVLYIPKAPDPCQDPNKSEWRTWMMEQTRQLIEISQGRALVLVTATKAVAEVGDYLSKHLILPVKGQSRNTTNSHLIEWFKSTPNAVLIGTSSFWEGISIEGDDLKLVVIDKMPFTPPTEPIQQAREAWYNNSPALKSKKFFDLGVYPAIIRLKQGFGRLIRTKTDTGAVAIFDPRIQSKAWGKMVLASLPPATQVSALDDPRLAEVLK